MIYNRHLHVTTDSLRTNMFKLISTIVKQKFFRGNKLSTFLAIFPLNFVTKNIYSAHTDKSSEQKRESGNSKIRGSTRNQQSSADRNEGKAFGLVIKSYSSISVSLTILFFHFLSFLFFLSSLRPDLTD